MLSLVMKFSSAFLECSTVLLSLKTEEIFQGLLLALSQDTGFQDQLKEYEYALERLSNATTDEGRFNAIQDIDKAFVV